VPLLVRSPYVPEAVAVRVLAALALLVAVARPGLGQPATAASDPHRSIKVTYADGRTAIHQIRRSGEVWTPMFPRIAGAATSRDGLALTALAIAHQVEGEAVVATVSLLYGLPHQGRVKVATVPVTSQPVMVDELRAFGVRPISLAMASTPDAVVFAPATASASDALELTVTPLAAHTSAYRFVVVNHSSRGLTALRYEAYRGPALAISGMRRGRRNVPLLGPGGADTFELAVGSGGYGGQTPGPPVPLDRVVITSVLWEDNRVEGDQKTGAEELEYYAQRAHGLRLVLPVLRQAGGMPAQELRSRLSALRFPVERGALQIRDGLLADLTRAAGPLPLDRWLATTIPAYEQWLARLSGHPR
jgi:hypothetical protein